MNRDVSGNDVFDDHVDSSVDSSDSTSGSDSSEVSSTSGKTVNEYESESSLDGTTVYVANTYDYSPALENITVLLIFISALLVAYGLAFAFFKGFKK